MKGDFTRFRFGNESRYSDVLQQQGRVSLDSDWNEAAAINTWQRRQRTIDAFGRFAAIGEAFRVTYLPNFDDFVFHTEEPKFPKELLAARKQHQAGEISNEALRAIEKARPDVILLDIKMPGIDGYEFAQMYRDKPGKKAPIIVITAAQSAQEAAAKVEACSFLGKPFGVDQLLAHVSSCLEDGAAVQT